jgi:hypothetical protein
MIWNCGRSRKRKWQRGIQNMELHNLYSSLLILYVIKLRMVRCGETRNALSFWKETSRGHFGEFADGGTK